MVFYLVTQQHRYAIDLFIQLWAPELRGKVKVVPYERIDDRALLPSGVYIFTDLERLTPKQDAIVRRFHDRLQQLPAGQVRIFNPPDKALGRFELLDRLYDLGINDYQAARVRETRRPARFPVFIKAGRDHGGQHVQLLRTQREYEIALATRHVLRSDLEEALVVEFLDTRGPDGSAYLKYSAFIFGQRVVPRHRFVSESWVVKHASLTDASRMEAELDYLDTNPHEQQIREIAKIGGFDYGRIDYGMAGDKLQVWEFNTNPVIFSPVVHFHEARLEMQRRVARDIAKEFEELATFGDGGSGHRATPFDRSDTPPPLSGAGKIRHAFRSVPWIRRAWRGGRDVKRVGRNLVHRGAAFVATVLHPVVVRRLEKNLWARAGRT